MSGQWNLKNPAVKRIVQELKEIQRDDNPDILAEAMEENIFEWYFAIRGAWDTDFEEGIYIGRILMPAEYPFKPPAFVMHTPSGRFETGTKICLSISSFHPESWQPSWSVRSALIALIAFMQTPGNGAVGSLDTNSKVRKQIAAEARANPPKVSNAERQEQVNALHQRMLEMEEESRALYNRNAKQPVPAEASEEAAIEEESEVAIATPSQPPQSPENTASDETNEETTKHEEAAAAATTASLVATPQASTPIAIPSPVPVASPALASTSTPVPAALPQTPLSSTVPSSGQPPISVSTLQPPQPALSPLTAAPVHPSTATASWEDRGLTYLAALLGALLLAVLLRRVVLAFAPASGNDALLFSVNPSADIDIEL